MNELTVQRNYKDTIFRMLFKDKENLLSLYNALNKTDYTDVNGLEITTLENAVYMNYKNDVSFMFDSELMLYEHQSTMNPEIQTLKLSSAYEKRQEYPDLELKVTVYNINRGHNNEIMDACRTLREYAQYVERVRTYAKQMPLAAAVEKAVDECIAEGILTEFLRKNRAEAIKMSIYEYDEELHFRTLYEEGMEDGIERGKKLGFEQGREQGESRLNKLHAILIESDRLEDLKRATQDRAYQERLMLELLPEEMQNI